MKNKKAKWLSRGWLLVAQLFPSCLPSAGIYYNFISVVVVVVMPRPHLPTVVPTTTEMLFYLAANLSIRCASTTIHPTIVLCIRSLYILLVAYKPTGKTFN